MKNKHESQKGKYWYEIFMSECVLCGRRNDYRVRRPLPKPEPEKRRHFEQTACGNHFL